MHGDEMLVKVLPWEEVEEGSEKRDQPRWGLFDGDLVVTVGNVKVRSAALREPGTRILS